MPYIGRSEKFGVRNRFYYTQASGGATSISGNDDAGKGLSFTDGAYVDVALNGVTLVAGTDYNTTTANTIAGLSALSAGDIIEILVYDVFNVADTVSATSGGTFSGGVTMGGTLAVTGASTLSSTLGVTGKITSTAGITFGSDTAATNVLDDYEEGALSLSSSTGTASFSVPRYTKVGNQVTVRFYVDTFSDTSTASAISITGLPYASSSSNVSVQGTLGRYANTISGDGYVAYVGPSSSSLIFFKTANNANYAQIQHAHLTSASAQFFVTLTYEAA